MLPLQPSLANDRAESLARYIAENDLPEDWQPDPEDMDPFLAFGMIPDWP
jgi:hypothetical protein